MREVSIFDSSVPSVLTGIQERTSPHAQDEFRVEAKELLDEILAKNDETEGRKVIHMQTGTHR